MTAMRPLRVLMVAPSFPPFRGGVETHVHEVGRRLVAEHGFEIAVLTTDRSRQLPRTQIVDGMTVTRVPAWPRSADLYWAPEVLSEVGRSDADLIHVQGYHTFVPPLAMLAARRRQQPYLLTFHSGGHSSWVRHAVRPVQIRLLRPLLRGAARLVAVSSFEAQLFARTHGIGEHRIVTIPNGADLPEGSDPGPLPRTDGLVLSVGRLERYKGHRRLIEALPRVRERVPHARLMILGTGPDEAVLRQMAEELAVADAVEVVGLPRHELPPLLRQAQVVGLLSEYESHGIAVQEALALAARVVVTDASALAEVAHLPQVEAVSRDAAPSVVAAAVIRQLEAGPIDEESVPTLPTWDDCADRLADLYGELARSRQRSRETS